MRQVPKIELHIHLEGAIRPETVRELSMERLGWSGPLPRGWHESYYTYTDFQGFMAQLTPRFPGGPDEYYRIALECFEDLAAQLVVYTEVSFDVPVRSLEDTDRFWPIVEALEAARRDAQERFPMEIRYIAALMRTLPLPVCFKRVELAIAARECGIGIVGIDLHGDETASPPEHFAPVYQLAAVHGLGLRAHAGEARGPESIRGAIDVLGATRIGHGVRVVEDLSLVQRLRRGDVLLELCPTSNVRTAIVPSLAEHPIRWLYDQGVPVAVSSDDPLPFFTTIERECRLLVEEFGFSREDLRQMTLGAARASFLSAVERARLLAVVDAGYEAASGHASETA
ncbi:MAG TPA: adenosine deaminase [Chloroflexota bacterium]